MRAARSVALLGAMALGVMGFPRSAAAQPPSAVEKGLTAVAGIKVGQVTLSERPTGCTVILAEAGAVAGVDVRGGAPGTRETDLLDPVSTVDRVQAVVLAGGSAFGLEAATGAVRWLEEHGLGYETRAGRVPIVPAAILFDLGIGDGKARPTAGCGYEAAAAATTGPVAEGNVGAGAGATVGKLLGPGRAMKGGIGTAAIVRKDGLVVAALVAVNAVGTVIDPATGGPIAGVLTEDGKAILDPRALLLADAGSRATKPGENTTLVVVATNAALTKAQATKVAQMAQDGLARAIFPSHLPSDGDTAFALATGQWTPAADVGAIGALAAEVVSQAIVRAVRQAKGIRGYPASDDLALRVRP